MLSVFIIVKFENSKRLVTITVFFIISDEKIRTKLKNSHLKDVFHH
jgi:hypothetical protein